MAWITEPMYYLSYTQALNNAEIVFSEFNKSSIGLTKEAICGVLGNMWRESHVNPNMSEEGGGTTPAGAGAGLVQWTPATELTKHMTSSDTWNDGYFQMRVLIQELSPNNINNGGSSYGQWYDVGSFTYAKFVTTTDVDYATECFMRCYERPGVTELAERIEYARKFYQDITGEVPSGDGTQLAVLPCWGTVYITQAEGGDFSHQGSLSVDFAYPQPKVPLYAPFDMTCKYVDLQNAFTVWQSDRPVKCADGSVSYVTFNTGHSDDTGSNSIGDKKKKGQVYAHTGTSGNVTGDHTHIECSKGEFTVPWATNPAGNGSLPNPEHMYNVFSSCNNITKEEINIINQTSTNMPWVCILNWDDGGSTPPEPPEGKSNLITLLMVNALNGWYNY